ncbi:MAG: phosphatase family protein [Bacilli bacterium]|nr:phosphatase family protein [Bacilli bacterium]
MNPYIRRILPLSTMLIFPFLGMLYDWVNHANGKVYNVMTDLDRMIPFIKYLILPYSIWIFYIYVCLVYFFIKDVKVYYRSLLTYTVCTLICYFIYSIFQTTVPRPILVGDDFFTRLISYVYNWDLPYNCFPSIHCFSCYMVMKALYRSDFRNHWNQILIYGMSTLIILSTFLVKQHAILDAFGGFALVELVYLVLNRVEILTKSLWNKNDKTWDV